MDSCETAGITVSDHFREVTKLIMAGKGAQRSVKDYMLTRYACYLIAQNGDVKKEEIAFAQAYFAVQTRRQELIEERISYIERSVARTKLKESENGCRKIYISVELMTWDSPEYVQKAIQRYSAAARHKK